MSTLRESALPLPRALHILNASSGERIFDQALGDHAGEEFLVELVAEMHQALLALEVGRDDREEEPHIDVLARLLADALRGPDLPARSVATPCAGSTYSNGRSRRG